jgi:hypothetical protein
MKDFVSRTYQIPDQQIEVAPIPANLNMIKPHDKNTAFRAQNGLSGFVVLYAGNFAQYQDFDTLLDAAKLLKHRKDVTFAFVGDGAKREYIGQRIADEHITNVRLLPFVPEEQLCDMLASADVSLVHAGTGRRRFGRSQQVLQHHGIRSSHGCGCQSHVRDCSRHGGIQLWSTRRSEDSSSLARAISTLAINLKGYPDGIKCKKGL